VDFEKLMGAHTIIIMTHFLPPLVYIEFCTRYHIEIFVNGKFKMMPFTSFKLSMTLLHSSCSHLLLQHVCDSQTSWAPQTKIPKKIALVAETSAHSVDTAGGSNSENDAVLEAIFRLIVLALESTSNMWLKPSEIASFLHKGGVSDDLDGFHVCLAINKFTCWNIIQSHQLKLPGDNEEQEIYFHLACITDAETPSTQHFSETGGCIPSAMSSTFDSNNLKGTSQDNLEKIDAFCEEEEEDIDDNISFCSHVVDDDGDTDKSPEANIAEHES
jgi:hypothetical protein